MRYALKKLISAIVTLFVVSVAVFFAFAVIPGDPALRKLGTQATPEALEMMRSRMGLDQPLPVRYVQWVAAFFTGDMGTSFSYDIPVGTLLGDKLPVTGFLVLFSFVLLVVLSIPLSIWHAKHENSRLDRAMLVAGQVIMAVPPFFMGILLTFFFGIVLKLFTPGGYVSWQTDPGRFLAYLFWPSLAIALPRVAMTVKLFRAEMLREAGRDYVRTAYSRGHSTMDVLYRHVLKNAFLPLLTFLAMNLTDMVAGSVVIEQVFGIPGFGRFLLVSILGRDYPVVEAIIMGLTAFIILVNLVTDLLYRAIDPRIEEAS
ncbi:MAG: ABC transporter permease [Lachnospiraceae bacterium]|nr:ABC transporter permease [Lachnospiraceae bacterium]